MADVGMHVLKKGFLVKKVKVWFIFLFSLCCLECKKLSSFIMLLLVVLLLYLAFLKKVKKTCGGIFGDSSITHFLLSVPVKKNWKSNSI